VILATVPVIALAGALVKPQLGLCREIVAFDKARGHLTVGEQAARVRQLTPPKMTRENQRFTSAFIMLFVVYAHPSVVDETDRDLAVKLVRAECDGNVAEATRLIDAIDSAAQTEAPPTTR
jgi:hypothetical protein